MLHFTKCFAFEFLWFSKSYITTGPLNEGVQNAAITATSYHVKSHIKNKIYIYIYFILRLHVRIFLAAPAPDLSISELYIPLFGKLSAHCAFQDQLKLYATVATLNMAYEFLLPALTPSAQKVVQTQPEVVTTLIVVLVGLIILGVGSWYIGFAVRKPGQKKPAAPPANAPAKK